jgi:metallo-beta-lactamase family protein
MRIQFLGANRQVTGSRYYLEAGGLKLLIDCGLFQERSYLERNWEPFPASAGQIDFLLLTHAHLDHSGLIPRFVKQGYTRPILTTGASADLAEIVLLDSAHLLEEDAALKKKRHEQEGRSGPHPEIPLYTAKEAEQCFPLFEEVDYGKPARLSDHLTVRYHDAGHILGSSSLELEVQDRGSRTKLIFSGDIGQWNKPLVKDPSVFDQADYVIMESTYGNRSHEAPGKIEDSLAELINRTVVRGGNIVVPIFAVERAQEFLFYLGRLVGQDRIPHLLAFLDSPMAVEVTKVFLRHIQDLDEEARAQVRSGHQPFEFPGLKLLQSQEESKSINRIKGSCIIMAGSGMCTGGRIKHHLTYNIGRSESTILFVGYQARETLGRQILEGKPEVRIYGKPYKVRAQIAQIEGFSGHADQADLMRWLKAFKQPPRRLFLTHGEEEAALSLAKLIEEQCGWSVAVPSYRDIYELDEVKTP